MAEDMQFLKLSIESHDRQIGELTDRLAAVGTRLEVLGTKLELQAANLDKLIVVTHDLVTIAQRHEERLDRGGL
jgi:hypothetical protein